MSLDLSPFDLGKRKAKAQRSRLTLRMLFPADINTFGGRRGKTWGFTEHYIDTVFVFEQNTQTYFHMHTDTKVLFSSFRKYF